MVYLLDVFRSEECAVECGVGGGAYSVCFVSLFLGFDDGAEGLEVVFQSVAPAFEYPCSRYVFSLYCCEVIPMHLVG